MRKTGAPLWSAILVIIVLRTQAQITESPETVARGRFLVEMDAFSLTVDRNGGDHYTGIGIANTLLTTGLGANWDIQFGAEFYLSQELEQGGIKDRQRGIGDLYVRTKWRLFSDPKTGTALAVIPYVKIPTNSGGVGNRSVEGGVILPWATVLPGGFALAAMGEVDLLRNPADDGYDTAVFGSVALSRQITGTVGWYAELAGGKSSGGASWAGALGAGVTYAARDNVTWDLAVYRGLSRGAPDWNPVLRLTWAF